MKTRLLLTLALLLSAFGLSAQAQNRPQLLANGTDAPDFTANKPDGSPVKLSDFRGKVVLVDFWATWCPPCKKAMPHMENLHQKLGAQGLQVLGVCVWDKQEAFDGWQTKPEVPTTYLKVFDPAGRAPGNIAKAKYNVSGIPTFYLIGKDGKILFSGVGAGPDTEEALDEALKSAGFKL
ncbi:TlpA disulfide reductase family protein [Opitutus sp. ER46]|uniref:TlpA family protein disulfide reductase n=1 Tax=Opitutus sp. ER46 TaxID=2161864 RepID=UPI000D2FB65A|nr:TlpA disulfide reductase family protein [Opitutus sp. ER46]PTX91470.1 TlpA family protein disulfide reductase [Opitutus sp. ER46]